ncbi:nitroreductase family protein [Abyssisolibacter fermentans]|uniref:nitroreductase family protein n=1 Tax=Abyssisolibacter fermentans TaxID=1766203 RepID=UPI000834A2A7|nr:nitroreductase family protein [Abyssisolibacter fermentans]
MNVYKERHSVRSYSFVPLEIEHYGKVYDLINNTCKLYDNIGVDIKLIDSTDNIMSSYRMVTDFIGEVKAPYYLVLSSQKKEGYLYNIGYIGEEIILEFTKLGIGTCWVGSPVSYDKLYKEVNFKDGYEFVILIAFGYPDDNEVSKIKKRLHKDDIVFKGEIKKELMTIMDIVKMAPSSLNSQPWRIHVDNNTWHIYMKKGNTITNSSLHQLNKIDMGIAIRHIIKGSKEQGFKPEIISRDNMKTEGLDYVLSINFN